MDTRFRITALPLAAFSDLIGLADAELAARGARRVIADSNPGFPCRVSLLDAEVGESLILTSYEHQPADTPYRANGPVFVRETATEARPAVGEVPQSVRRRLLSVRAYDSQGTLLDADVAEGTALDAIIDAFFADSQVAYLHLHNAKPGCYSCRVDRA
ncbi:MAG: DUF1203 domain-containing protein [Armatimonadetes bacterium]|nr:DUF1203 domain-containing protein [Armatimonadota bacterium]